MTRHALLAGTALALASASTAQAGGLERSVLSFAPLFEEGRYLEFSGAFVTADLEGQDGFAASPFTDGLPGPLAGATIPFTGSTGDLLENYALFGAAYKAQINDRLSYGIFLNQPYGADTAYPLASTPLTIPPSAPPETRQIYSGSGADVRTVALTAVLAYDVTDQIKIWGGPVLQAIRPEASILFPGFGYSVEADTNYGTGLTFGAAYSIPDIALRVALSYRSEISHDLDTTENSIPLGTNETSTDFDTPQSLTLDFQTGVAEDTLVFGQIHWADWSDFAISPPNYIALTNGRPLVAYAEDYYSYTLGVGRRFDENWSGAVSLVYEPQRDIELTSLGPVDGRMGINLGATYETEDMKISGGISYTRLGDARNVLNTDYDDGDAIGVGFRIGWKL